MAKKKISKELEEKLKKIYPEGIGLDHDRDRRAEKKFDPSKAGDIEKWSEKKTTTDLKGFDTPDAKEISVGDAVKSLVKGDSGDKVLQTEPDRFVDPNSEAGRLIQAKKDKIVDLKSFIQTVKDAWDSDDALPTLLANVSSEKSYEDMYKNPTIQGYVDSNTRPAMINYVMKRFGVEPVRASNIVTKLPQKIRAKLYHKARVVSLPKITIPKTKARGRHTTNRQRWSDEEVNIIRANRNQSPERVAEIFNSTTSYNRSFTSIRNRLYRIRRE